jgi:signal transduction histidine kinase
MRLFDFIKENMETILQEWETFARNVQPAGGDMEVSELRDHAEEMLRVIAADMQTPQTLWERSNKSRGGKPREAADTAAETHAVSRLASGFSINLLVAEYRALRASVLDLWLWQHEHLQPDEVGDLIRFNEAIDQTLAEAVDRYSEIILMEQNVFLGVLGHDLRTPLQSIGHGAEYLMHANARNSKAAQLGMRMQNSVKRMAGMLDNLLDFTQSRINGGIQFVPTETDLSKVAEQVVAELRSNNPGRLIRNEIQGDCKGVWDAGRIAQIYQNLISNALQYGDQDRAVTVTTEGNATETVIRVHNQGIPIPEQEQERIFDPLQRHVIAEGEEIPRRNLGLGLYIVREIVLAHCGAIVVTSTKAEGTNFVIRLPKEPDAACWTARSHKSRVARATSFTLQ